MPKKILITGPESTGKSTLTQALAAYFDVPFVPEFAREYLEKLERPYQESDLLEIAKGQVSNEDILAKKASDLLFCDTDLTVIDIWSREKFGKTNKWILEQMEKRAYDLYLMPDIDLEWTFDLQRENPNDRERLMKLYQESFERRKIPFYKVRGQGEERLRNAIEIVKKNLK